MDWNALDDSPSLIRAFLSERGLALKKRWGQNFMVSRVARERIVSALDALPGEPVWEIGSGLGAITSLLAAGNPVTVFEVDYGLMDVIRDRFGDTVRIVAGDAVKTLETEPGPPPWIVGNLPYRSAAAIVSTLLERPAALDAARRMVFTVQREMALRMVASPGTSDYSPFTVLVAVSTGARLAGDLSHGNFYPAPEVTSSVVVLEPRPGDAATRIACSTAARSLFTQRRKTIANNVPALAQRLGVPVDAVRAMVTEAGIELDARAERIEPARFFRLGEIIASRVVC